MFALISAGLQHLARNTEISGAKSLLAGRNAAEEYTDWTCYLGKQEHAFIMQKGEFW